MTSPLEREILTHYYVSPEPYLGGSENWSQLIGETVERFARSGLLVSTFNIKTGAPKITCNLEALTAYMAALAKVPLPVQTWIVPKVSP